MFVRSTRRLSVAIALALIALLVPAVAGATGATTAAKKKHKVNLTVRAASVATQGNSSTVVGTFSGPPFSSGVVVYRTKPAGSNLAATYKAFTDKGVLRGTTLVTPAPQQDGSTNFTGTLQVKSGTGRFRGAKGKNLAVTGKFVPADGVFTFQIKGTVRY